MFKRREPGQNKPMVTISFEGTPFKAAASETVAAALLASGVEFMRTTHKKHHKRAGYCQMGVCFDCLVEIDGQANQQACIIQVRDGMKIKRQAGIRKITV
ncbi:MAG: (2Fe-2S)-binding protein [Desulfobacterales bacterium]|nr:(2Fe-2S)-binding protein [Desulfobacterales bacterium]